MRSLRNETSGMRSTGSSELGGRVAIEADVPGLLHKSDAGAVKPA
jgi:hypothetical protein